MVVSAGDQHRDVRDDALNDLDVFGVRRLDAAFHCGGAAFCLIAKVV